MSVHVESLTAKAEARSIELFEQGYYCSEAVLQTVEELMDIQFPDYVRRGMTAFGEGLSSGCLCGSLNSSIFIMSMFAGRLNTNESVKPSQKLSAEMTKAFTETFSSTCCRVITKKHGKMFGIGKYKQCPNITGFCAAKLVEIIEREGWTSKNIKTTEL